MVQAVFPFGATAICYDSATNGYSVVVISAATLGEVEPCPEDGALFADLIVSNGVLVKQAFE